MGIFNAIAVFFTEDSDSFCPLPAGLSGAVTTQTTFCPDATMASKDADAKSGVPKNTIRIALPIMPQRY